MIKFPFIAIYDASREEDKYDSSYSGSLGLLGETFADADFSGVARIGAPSIHAILQKMHDAGAHVVALSPAASKHEHKKIFRLSEPTMPVIYTGRGALGADVVALSSADAVCVLGEDEEAVLGILGCVEGRGVPIALFSPNSDTSLREKISIRYPAILPDLFTSNEIMEIVKFLKEGTRKNRA